MTGIRKFIYGSVVALAALTLFQLPFVFGATALFDKPDTIQGILRESGVYDQIVPSIIQDAQTSTTDQNAQQLLSDPEVQAIITAAVSPKVIDQSITSITNGVAPWLKGDAAEPSFRVDLSDTKNQLVTDLNTYIEKRTAALPICTPQQLQTTDFQKDILNLPCRPDGIAPSMVASNFTNNIIEQISFLRDPVIDSDTLINDARQKGQSVESSSLPSLYQAVMNARWVVLAQAIILLTLLVAARRNKLAGGVIVAKVLITVGLALGIIALIQLFTSTSSGNSDAITQATIAALSSILDELFVSVQRFAIGYLVIGTTLFALLRNRAKIAPTDSTPSDPTQLASQ